MSDLQIGIQTSRKADGFPVVTWVQESLSGRAADVRLVWWAAIIGLILGVVRPFIVPPTDPNTGLMENMLFSGVVGAVIAIMVMASLLAMAQKEEEKDKEKAEKADRRRAILIREPCRAEIVQDNGVPTLQVIRRDRNALMWRCEMLMMLLMTPLMPRFVRDAAAEKLSLVWEASALAKASPWLEGVKNYRWSMPLANLEGFQLTRENEWFRTFQTDRKSHFDQWIIVAHCGEKGVRVVVWHAGDKAFVARLHAVLNEVFILNPGVGA